MSAQELKLERLISWGFAPGSYACFCLECGKQHVADKRAWRCLDCAERRANLPPTDAEVMAHPKVRALETRVTELEAERDEADDLAKAAFADGASNNILLAEAAHRIKLLETRAEEAEACVAVMEATIKEAALARRAHLSQAADAKARADLPPTDAEVMAHPKVKALVEAVRHEREMVCQDFGMQLAASQAVDAALAAIKGP